MARGPELRENGYDWPSGECTWANREWFVSTLNILRDILHVGGGVAENFVSPEAKRREKTARWALAVATYVLCDAPDLITGMSVKWLVRSLNEMGLLDAALKSMDDEEPNDDEF